jgi:pimeloyl-ACP methyl ester carboxylesterase
MHDEALLLPDVFQAAGITDPILIGHSDGASISILYAADHPVRGLVLEAPHVFGEEVSFASIARAKEAYEKGGLRERLARTWMPPFTVGMALGSIRTSGIGT